MNISFIIPAFNCSSTIIESLDSIKLNYENGDEIVIVNDASTDNTLDIIEGWINNNKNIQIKVVNHFVNLGGGAARNTAVLNTKNDLIFCLDSDNILVPNSVNRLKSFLLDNNYDIVCFQKISYFINSSTKEITHEWVFKFSKYDFYSCLKLIQIPPASGNYLYKKKTWIKAKGYPDYAGALDAWGFGLKQCANGYDIHPLPDSNYLHRHGTDSYWVREEKSGTTSLNALRVLLEFKSKLNIFDVVRISTFNSKNWLTLIELYPIKAKTKSLFLNCFYFVRLIIQLVASIFFFHKFRNLYLRFFN
jgi:glycosyltransferase involved in cell wall biosynthesis